jgi:glutaredoxin
MHENGDDVLSSEKQVLSEPTVTFYTKAGCHLCDDAREMLEEIATEIAYNLTEIDIRSDMALFELYRYRIPVIIVNETHMVEGRIEYSDLLGAFQR